MALAVAIQHFGKMLRLVVAIQRLLAIQHFGKLQCLVVSIQELYKYSTVLL